MSVESISIDLQNVTNQIKANENFLTTRGDLSSEAGINSRVKQERTRARQTSMMQLPILKTKQQELIKQLELAKQQEANSTPLKDIVDSTKMDSRGVINPDILVALQKNPVLLALAAIILGVVVLK